MSRTTANKIVKNAAVSALFGTAVAVLSFIGAMNDPVDNPHFGQDASSEFIGEIYRYSLKPVNMLLSWFAEHSGLLWGLIAGVDRLSSPENSGFNEGLAIFAIVVLTWALLGYCANLILKTAQDRLGIRSRL